MAGSQISAFISDETQAQIEAYVKRHGVKKAFLIEEALQHHLQALRELPADVLIPARITLTAAGLAGVAEQLEADDKPCEALRALMRD